jgi:hypothetical protein
MNTRILAFSKQSVIELGRVNLQTFVGIVFFLLAAFISNGQVPKGNEAAVKAAETELALAKSELVKAERLVYTADSMLTAGTNLQNEGKMELKNAETEMKAFSREDQAARKPLEKQATSKDKADAIKATEDIKKLDIRLYTQIRDNDTKSKNALKKITAGDKAFQKAKSLKVTAQNGLLAARNKVKLAEEKLTKAKGSK